jgi:RHS repeat-associated protein
VKTYDPNGKLLVTRDPLGHTTTNSYDLLENLLQTTYADNSSTESAYDANSQRTARTDQLNRTTFYTYDPVGRLTVTTYPTTAAGIGTTETVYDSVGRTIQTINENGHATSFAYDDAGRQTSVTDALGNVTSSRYDANGNRVTTTDANGHATAFVYDAVNRLTSTVYADQTSDETAYDATGSVTGVALQTGLTYGPNDTVTADTYDDNGNTRVSDGTAYGYDFEDRLTSKDNGAVTIAYDGDGNRVSKTVGGVTTTYLIDDAGPTGYAQTVEERVGGAVQKSYVYGQGPVSQRQLVGSSWTTSYYTQDASLNVRALTDSSGNVTDTWDYDAFGTVVARTGSTPNSILFAGEYVDGDLGLVYLRARWMDQAEGRFVTRDPEEQSDELPSFGPAYSYANANPANWRDPSGRWTLMEVSVSIGVVTALAVTPVNIYAGRGVIESTYRGVAAGVIVGASVYYGVTVGAAAVRVLATIYANPWLLGPIGAGVMRFGNFQTLTNLIPISVKDAQIMSQVMLTPSTGFMEDLQILGGAVAAAMPGYGQVYPLLGPFNGSPVFGGVRTGVGIVEQGGQTMVVQKVGQSFNVLGPRR